MEKLRSDDRKKSSTANTENRRYVRFATKDAAFTALGPDYIKVGKINDISMGGLSFKYISSDLLSKNSFHLNIFLTGTQFNLSNIPCRIVYEIPLHQPIPNYTYNSEIITNRCGVQFDNLNENIQAKLNYFLQNYTDGISAMQP